MLIKYGKTMPIKYGKTMPSMSNYDHKALLHKQQLPLMTVRGNSGDITLCNVNYHLKAM